VRGIVGYIEQAERKAQPANPHKHTITFAHFYPQQWFLYHTGLYEFRFKFKTTPIEEATTMMAAEEWRSQQWR
jgi:hypothetical protein